MPRFPGRRSRRINPRSDSQRATLRLIGGILCAVGGVFVLVGMVSFFQSFNSFGGPPSKFWCVFVGAPMLAIGSRLLMLGYMGAVARYTAGEVAPVATDTLNFVADETRSSVRKVSGAIAAGVRDASRSSTATEAGPQVACPSCHHDNDPDARFCDQCGTAMPGPNECGGCGKVNDSDARFCSGCGSSLA